MAKASYAGAGASIDGIRRRFDVKAGLSPREAIETASLVPARVMGLEKDTGTVDVGKRADLILVDGNPLERISDLRKVKWVVANGVLYETSRLSRGAGFEP